MQAYMCCGHCARKYTHHFATCEKCLKSVLFNTILYTCQRQHATALRATEATGVHDASSRSHAVCRIYISTTPQLVAAGNDDSTTGCEGVLTLVDLAGSEMRIDSDKHDAGAYIACNQTPVMPDSCCYRGSTAKCQCEPCVSSVKAVLTY